MTRKNHKINKKVAVLIALVVLAATALVAGNGHWNTPVGHSANGHWLTPTQLGGNHWR